MRGEADCNAAPSDLGLSRLTARPELAEKLPRHIRIWPISMPGDIWKPISRCSTSYRFFLREGIKRAESKTSAKVRPTEAKSVSSSE